METKEQLIYAIKKWVRIDNEIRTLQKELSKRRNEKVKISSELIDIMKTHEIDCFSINDGQIEYTKKNIKKPINQKSLTTILSQYFDGDFLKASELKTFIMENREEAVTEKIVRKIKKGGDVNTSNIPIEPLSNPSET